MPNIETSVTFPSSSTVTVTQGQAQKGDRGIDGTAINVTGSSNILSPANFIGNSNLQVILSGNNTIVFSGGLAASGNLVATGNLLHNEILVLNDLVDDNSINLSSLVTDLTNNVNTTGRVLYNQITELSGALNTFVTNTSGIFTLNNSRVYVFTGNSPVTWTVPLFSNCSGRMYYIKNRGNATVTITGGGSFYSTSSGASLTMLSGESYTLVSCGYFWNLL